MSTGHREEGARSRIVVDDLREAEQTLRIRAGETVRYLIPALGGTDEPRQRTIVLEDEGAAVDVFGLFVGHGQTALKLTLDTIHAAPRTRSRTLFKGALTGASAFDINGVIRMTRDAHGADAFLEERALLLSDQALANAVPSLEIEANDVKCKHAASAGPVDPEQLFYLRSRGLSEAEAEALVVRGFLAAVLGEFDAEWQNRISELLRQTVIVHV